MKPIYGIPYSFSTYIKNTIYLGSRGNSDYYLAECIYPFIVKVWAENQYSTLSLNFECEGLAAMRGVDDAERNAGAGANNDLHHNFFKNKAKRLLLLK
jgi:hypothetical protein